MSDVPGPTGSPAPTAGVAPTGALVAAVAAGGALGALARVGLTLLLPSADGGWPVATLVANLLGALLLGVLAARPMSVARAAFWRTGVLGAFTTFSALAVETLVLAGASVLQGVTYLAVTVLGGLGAVRLSGTWRR